MHLFTCLPSLQNLLLPYTEKKSFVTPTKSFVKIAITKIVFCDNKTFGNIDKTGCCGKIFGCSNKNFTCGP